MPPRAKKTVAEANGMEGVEPDTLAAVINKQFGAGSIGYASDPEIAVTRQTLGAGCKPLDDLFDGGLPAGRFVELYGPYSTLKSYTAYKALGAFQRAGKRVGLIDTEHSFDPEWAIDLGLDPSGLLISRPENAEHGIGVMEALIRQRYDLVVFDSIAAAIPKQHQESAPGEDTQPGALARVMSKGLARLNAANKVTTGVFINQTRSKIGVTFGSPMTTSGGAAMGFYASYRVSFSRIEKITEPYDQWDGKKWVSAKRVIKHKIKATLEKSKLSAPNADVIFDYDLRTGEIDERGYVVAKALEAGLLTRSSAGHWGIPDVLDKPIHGADKFFTYLDDNPEVVEALKELL